MSDNGWQRVRERSRWENQLLRNWWHKPVVIAGQEWRHGTQRFFPSVSGAPVVVQYIEGPSYFGDHRSLRFRLKRFLVIHDGTGKLLSPKAFTEFMRREVEASDI